MSEFLLELYSEEIPPQLQINARNQLKNYLENSLKNEGLNYKECLEYSSPTRLSIYIKGLPEKIKIKPNEIYHLAAQSYPLTSFTSPVDTYETNILGTHNILNAIKKIDSILNEEEEKLEIEKKKIFDFKRSFFCFYLREKSYNLKFSYLKKNFQ